MFSLGGCKDIYIRMTKTNSDAEKPLTCRELFFDHLCNPSSSSTSRFLSSSSFPTSSFPTTSSTPSHAASAPSQSLARSESVAPRCGVVVSVGFRVCLVNATALRVKGRQEEKGADCGSGHVCFGRDFLGCQFVNY